MGWGGVQGLDWYGGDFCRAPDLKNAPNPSVTSYVVSNQRSAAQPSREGQSRRRGKQTQRSPQDELAEYLSEPPIDNPVYKADPLAWWREVGVRRFPRLSYMATDFLTIASSSAETERDFRNSAALGA